MFRKTTTTMVRDPVCGMQVDPAKAAGKATHEGRQFYFCSEACLRTFEGNPHAHGH